MKERGREIKRKICDINSHTLLLTLRKSGSSLRLRIGTYRGWDLDVYDLRDVLYNPPLYSHEKNHKYH